MAENGILRGAIEVSHPTRLISIAAGALALAGTLLLWPTGPALALVNFQGSAATTQSNPAATSLSVNKPAAAVAGNLLIAQIVFLKGSDVTVTAPAGWTLVVRTNSGSDIGSAIFRKFAGAAEPASYNWGFSQAVSAVGGMLAYSGVDPLNPIIAFNGASGGSGNLVAPSIAANGESWLTAFFGIKKRTSLSTPGGMSERYYHANNGDEVTAKAADQANPLTNPTGTRTSIPGASDKWVAQSVTLGSAPPDPLQVSKTVATTFTRTFSWTIDKSVEPNSWDLFTGDSGTSQYTVALTKSAGVDSAWAVSGTITIHNPNSVNASVTNVTDSVAGVGATVTDCTVGGVSQGGTTFTLPGGQTALCPYSATLTSGDSTINTATVTTSGAVAGGSDTEEVIFGAPTLINDSVTVTDSEEGDLGTFNVSRSEEYSRTFTCDADEGTKNNTATINEIQSASASASVTVNCHELEVSKTVDETEFTRTWEWTIEKLGDQTALILALGQQFEVNYDVSLDPTKSDSEHAISGTITIHNPAPIAASITNVTDQVNGTPAAVTCLANFPLTLAVDANLVCTYEADLDDGTATENTATVTIENGTQFTDTANVAFDEPTTEDDECVDVSDSEDASPTLPAEACAAPDPAPFEYARFVGPFEQCGEQQAVNTASFISKDTGAEGESNYTVTATVEGCGGGGDDGCTLSQGYWKTHSSHGPAPYDATWDGLENTMFFAPKNTQTYYQVLWTAPRGNAYYILAHQYIAAQLNELNDANFNDAQTAYDAATALFVQYTPAQVALLKGNNATRQQFISYAGTLGDYNSGITGPGHCDEDGTSAP